MILYADDSLLVTENTVQYKTRLIETNGPIKRVGIVGIYLLIITTDSLHVICDKYDKQYVIPISEKPEIYNTGTILCVKACDTAPVVTFVYVEKDAIHFQEIANTIIFKGFTDPQMLEFKVPAKGPFKGFEDLCVQYNC